MRTFALLIMLLNFSYFLWNQLKEKGDIVATFPGQSPFVQAENSLILLAELPSAFASLPEHEEKLAESVQPVIPEQHTENEGGSLTALTQAEISQAVCGVVSGFDDQTEATTFIEEIREMDIVGLLDIQQEQISSTWWVHLPPFKSQNEAQGVIDELVAKGIDNFYMRSGDLAGGISLGVFSREKSALTAQSEFLSRGYEANVKEIPRYVSKAYVAIEAADPILLEAPDWKAFLATKTKLEVTEKLCETIAR